MHRNLKLLVGVVAVMLFVAAMGQSQGNPALAKPRGSVNTPTPKPTVSNGGSNGSGAPQTGGSSTGTNGSNSQGGASSGNAGASSTQGANATGVPGNGQNAPAGATSIGQPGIGQSTTSVVTSVVVIAPTRVPPTVRPTNTPAFRFVSGGSSRGATGATGVPG